MPIYEYVCAGCGKVVEHLAKNFEDKPKVCPFCQKHDFTRLMSVTAPSPSTDVCPSMDSCEGASSSCCHGGPCRH